MNQGYRITPRNLGSLELATLCPACFWYRLHLRFQPVLNEFGAAVFSDCQSMQEAVIGYYLEKDGCLPKAFSPFCDISARVEVNKHWTKFGYLHKSGVWLYGQPDEVFYRQDGSVVIWDHKTAHPKSGDEPDEFLPQYTIQVTGYGLIAEEGLGLGRVSAGALGYWSIQNDALVKNPKKFTRDGEFWASFVPEVHPVDIDYLRIDKLLKEAIKFWESRVPPEGRKRCNLCKRLKALFAIQQSVDNEFSVQDRRAIAASGNDQWVIRSVASRLADRKSSVIEALNELQDGADYLDFDDGTRSLQWELLS